MYLTKNKGTTANLATVTGDPGGHEGTVCCVSMRRSVEACVWRFTPPNVDGSARFAVRPRLCPAQSYEARSLSANFDAMIQQRSTRPAICSHTEPVKMATLGCSGKTLLALQ